MRLQFLKWEEMNKAITLSIWEKMNKAITLSTWKKMNKVKTLSTSAYRICKVLLLALSFTVMAGCSPVANAQDKQSDGVLLHSKNMELPARLSTASRALLFDYRMVAVTGGTTTAQAQLFEPFGTRPDNGYPLVVWAHGTTGISNACAPSLSFDNFGNANAINSLLEQGYAVLAPDYEGFGTPAIHPYYVRASHANAVLASVTAVHQIKDTRLSDNWALIGHSQGGHVALAAARAELDSDFPLQAVAALAPGTDLISLSDQAFAAIDQALDNKNVNLAAESTFYLNVYGAYVAHAFKLVTPALKMDNLFGEDVAKIVDIATNESRCGEYAGAVQDLLRSHLNSGKSLESFGGLKRDWHQEPAIADLLIQEELGDEPQSAPLLIVQGDADRQIPVAATTAFVEAQRALGTDITYEVIPGARHRDVALDEFHITVDWLVEHFAP